MCLRKLCHPQSAHLINPCARPHQTIQLQQYSSHSMDPRELQHQELINALKRPLTEPYPKAPDKAPRGFDDALKYTCAGQQRNIFLDTGFQAWFACFMTNNQTHAAVQSLSDSDAEFVAHYICCVKPHPSIETLFQHTLHLSFRGRERRCEYKQHARLTGIQLDS